MDLVVTPADAPSGSKDQRGVGGVIGVARHRQRQRGRHQPDPVARRDLRQPAWIGPVAIAGLGDNQLSRSRRPIRQKYSGSATKLGVCALASATRALGVVEVLVRAQAETIWTAAIFMLMACVAPAAKRTTNDDDGGGVAPWSGRGRAPVLQSTLVTSGVSQRP